MATASSTVIEDEVPPRINTRASSRDRDEESMKKAQKDLKKKIEERKARKNKDSIDVEVVEDGNTSDSSVCSIRSSSKKSVKLKKNQKKSKNENVDSEQEMPGDRNKQAGKSKEDEKTNKEVAKEILADPKLHHMKQQLMDLCDAPDLGKMRTLMMERGMAAVQLLTYLQRRTTRIPAEVNKEMDGAIKVIVDSFVEMETRVHHAEARLQVYDEMKLTGQLRTQQVEEDKPEQQVRRERQTTHSYAQAVQNATSTLIIQSVNRNTAEVRKQLNRRTRDYEDKIEKVQPIRNGIKIQMKSAEEAEKLKSQINQDKEAQATIRIQNAGIKKKRIIIFNVPEQVDDAIVLKKIWSTLELDHIQDIREDIIQPLRAIKTKNEVRHIPMTMPETLANTLLKKKTLTFGFQDCRIQQYVTIQRCYKCLQYDHMAKDCKENNEYCSLCAAAHNYKDCTNRRRSCRLCIQHNEYRRKDGLAVVNTDHPVNSPSCGIYRALLQIRQLEAEQGKIKQTTGQEVVKRYTWVAWVRGKPTLERRQSSRFNAT